MKKVFTKYHTILKLIKSAFLLAFLLLGFAGKDFAQVNLTLAPPGAIPGGTGWSTAAGSSTTVVGGAIQLVNGNNNELGSVYYNTVENVTLCGAFTVDFDFQILPPTTAAAGYAVADGMTFFFVNPLNNFTAGMDLGLPNPTDGFVLALDVWNNGPGTLTPLAAAYGFPTGYGGTYVEGSTTDLIGSIDNNQNWIIDGAYHHVHIGYYGGVISIWLNTTVYTGAPNITGNFPITFAGYFGFTSSTGGSASIENVKNVVINSNTISPITGTTTLCAGATATLSDPSLGTWSSNNPTVATINSTTGFLSTSTAGTATVTYSYSGSCSTTSVVTVSAPPGVIAGGANVCVGQTISLSDPTPGGSWTSSTSSIATVTPTTGVVSGGTTTGIATITYTTGPSCYVVHAVTVGSSPGNISGPTSICAGSTITLDDATIGGTWSSTVSNVATVGSSSAIVSGTTAGTTVISYSLGAGCAAVSTVTVIAVPGVIAGATSLCSGNVSTVLSDAAAGAGGTWSTSSSSVATVVTGVPGGTVTTGVAGTSGTTTITYSNGCGSPSITFTVIPGPNPITGGPATICSSIGTVTLSDATTGGTWTSGTTSVAAVGSLSGIVTAGVVTAGTFSTTVISYSNGCGSAATTIITVDGPPGNITPAPVSMCVGGSTTLSDAVSGTWTSGSPSVATINSATGAVSALSGGSSLSTSVITYSNGCGSPATLTLSVTAVPSATINGPTVVCMGAPVTLSNAVTGGTWTSLSPGNASVNAASGVVTGVIPGTTAVITYATGCGTAATTTVTVYAAPTTIIGSAFVCNGLTSTLSNDGVPVGTWSSSNPGAVAINSITGVVSGGVNGTSIITATNICGSATTSVTAATPTAISGTLSFCQNATTTLSDGVTGGVWSSGNTAVATTTGIVNDATIYGAGLGIPSGNAPITYTLGSGCIVVTTITTTPTPTGITGSFSLCSGATTSLTDASAGGVWTSSNPGVATVTNTGIVSGFGLSGGVPSGISVISYTIGTCGASATVTVNPIPTGIIVPSGVCVNSTITLSDATPLGNWSSSTPSAATVTSVGGVVTGVSAPGTTTITYTLGTTCYTTSVVTVNPLPADITGITSVCAGLTTTLSDVTAGGTWSSNTIGVATITPGPGVSGGVVFAHSGAGGTSIITYTLPVTGCYTTTVVTVNPLPGPIIGATAMCTGTTSTLTPVTSGGTWSSVNNIVASVGSATGVVTTGSPGNSVIIYTLNTGCTATLTLTVNQTPVPITGNATVCAGLQTTLSDSPTGGVWSNSNNTIATIGSLSGVVTALTSVVTTTTSTVTYTVAGCSAQTTLTVNPLPGVIVGQNTVCVGSSISLTDNTLGGTWSSNSPVASIGSLTAIITGVAPGGVATITDGLSTGCIRSFSVTVNPLPLIITGNTTICAGLTTVLSDATPLGTWSSNTAAITITPGPGAAGGHIVGAAVATQSTATVTYTLVTGCITTTVVTVNPLPVPITGILTMCSGLTTQLSDGTPGGVWSSSSTTVATVGAGTGFVTGGVVVPPSTPQQSVITYSLTATGCIITNSVTVNPLPSVITGNTTICAGLNTTLSDVVPGGVWTSSNPGVATIGSTSGFVTGISTGPGSPGGTAIITYTLGSGCIETISVLVNPLPAAITGTDTICSGLTTQLSDITPGGVWSSSSAVVATVGGGTGLVTGGVVAVASHAIITFSLTATGCLETTTVTVNPLPATIAGLSSVCEGATINLSNAVIGGVWSTSNSTVATVIAAAATGVVTGGSTGGALTAVDTITYTLGSGCLTTKTITVNIQPGAIINGPLTICNHSSASLSDAVPGGVWTSGNVNIATVDPTGLVTGSIPGSGIPGGTTNITYSIASCRSATSVFVNTQPVAITGITSMCAGAGVTLSDATPGGVWSTSNSSVATVTPSIGGGFVTGGQVTTQSIDTITYTIGTCIATTTVAVNVQPGSITGTTAFCNLSGTTLSDGTPGGVWSANNTNVTVGSVTGIVTGVMPSTPATTGSSIITYTETVGGCFAARAVTINIQPVAITGNLQVCNGLTTQLSDGTPGGVWSISVSTISIASINSTGLVTGLAAGVGGTDGLATSIYTIGTCSSSATVTVHPLPSVMTGAFYICEGSTSTLEDLTPGGTWSSANVPVASVGVVSGIVTAGHIQATTTITYILTTGCLTTHTVTVIPVPAAISPTNLSVCQGLTTQLSDLTNGGIWSTSNVAIASVGSSSGVVTGNSSGTVIITYVLGTGCSVVAPLVVNPLSPISGITTLCIGQTTNLSDSTIGGTWSSVNPLVATVNPVTGVVYGAGAGTTVIVYDLSTGCSASVSVTVLPLPLPITGITTICDGGTTTLSDASLGGAWNSSNPAVAAIDPTSGFVTAGPSGITTVTTDTITYQQGGCPITTILTINPLPGAIAGNTNICLGLTTTLSDPTPGGTWSSDNTLVATVDVNTGIVTGNLTGTANITYIIGTGCAIAVQVTVNPLPSAIGGIDTVCVSSCTQLSDAPVGGAWFSGTPSVATVGFVNGLVCGVSAGTSVITYQIVTGCIMTTTVVVNPLPSSISGSSSVCAGYTTNLFSGPGTGVWSSSNSGVATIDPLSGVVYGTSAGTTLISFTLGTGCASTLLMTVNPLPQPITGINTVCIGLTTQLFDATGGGTWSSNNPIIASVDPGNNGVVYGGSSIGLTTITYTLSTGCYITTPMAVNNPPVAITGPSQVCVGLSINLVDPGVPGGSWSSSNNGIATIDPVSGVVSGASQGTVIITYTMGGGSCFATYLVTVNPLPTPIIGITSVCAGLTTSLSDASLGGTWTSQSPTVATIDPSLGTVYGITAGTTVIVYTLPTTCSISAVVIVNPLPAPITGNTNVCLQNTRTLSDSPAPGFWSSSNSTVATVDPNTGVVSGSSVGLGTITYTLSLTGCIMTTTIAVHPLPGIFTVIGGGSYCAGTGGVHVGLSGSEIGVLYLLYLGSTPVGTYAGTGSALDFGAQVPGGVYTVIATNTFTTCSITMTGSATVTITPTVVPTVSISANPGDTVCAGTSVIYTPVTTHGGTGPLYQWSVNGLNVSTVTTYNFVPANGDVVRVTLTSDTVCAIPDTATALIKMTVLNSVTPAVGMLVSPGDTVCVGNPVTFTAVPSFGGTAPVYQWMVNSSLAYTPGPVYTYVPLDGDVVFVNMVSNYQCRLATTVSSNSVTIKVDSPVIPLVTITARPGAVISVGQTDTLTAVVTNGVGATYQWSIGGIPVPGATNATFVSNHFSYPRPDSVTCEVINTGACNEHTLAWIYIQVYPEGVTQISGTLNDLNVIPNPNKGIFTIKGTLGTTNDEEVTIELTDVLGQVMYKGKVIAKSGVMDQQVSLGANIANGMYMLNVRSESGSKVFHVVVEQ